MENIVYYIAHNNINTYHLGYYNPNEQECLTGLGFFEVFETEEQMKIRSIELTGNIVLYNEFTENQIA